MERDIVPPHPFVRTGCLHYGFVVAHLRLQLSTEVMLMQHIRCPEARRAADQVLKV